ncbi:MAG: Hsp70 family protein [Anaerolineae bacterium]|nr:Hsp70 family protein [Anaerolineae bacterium]
MRKIAVDFGTTNTIIAVWKDETKAPESLSLPGLSVPSSGLLPPLVPSILYVADGQAGDVLIGQAVRSAGVDGQTEERFFSSFKRGIAARTQPFARRIDGADWDDRRVGEVFLKAVLDAALAVDHSPIEELVLTVPIQSFEQYLKWLRDAFAGSLVGGPDGIQNLRVVDESTAAALGYDVNTPGDLILVFDFGGGTLDISLVRLPLIDEGGGVLIEPGDSAALLGIGAAAAGAVEARVVAKAGRVLGGDDIDYWLAEEVLTRNGVTRQEISTSFVQLKQAVEEAKIRLSDFEQAEVNVFDPDLGRTLHAVLTRSQMEDILDRHEFYTTVQRSLDKVMRAARARGIFPEDIGAVLLIGGTSQIPSVRRMMRAMFGAERVYEHKPFEAVAHGALNLAVGIGLDDFLYHSFGVRHLSPITGRHEWEEIISAGTRYPLPEPVQLVLTASRDGQEALELVIGEVEESSGGLSEVIFGTRTILMVDDGLELRQVRALNDDEGSRTVAYLDPPGRAGEDRVRVDFNVDQNRTLRVTIYDLLTNATLLHNVPVVELR